MRSARWPVVQLLLSLTTFACGGFPLHTEPDNSDTGQAAARSSELVGTTQGVGSAQEETPEGKKQASTLRLLGPGWRLVAPGLAEKRTDHGIMLAALDEQGADWLRGQFRQTLSAVESQFAKEPTAERESQVRSLRAALTMEVRPVSSYGSRGDAATGSELSTSFSGSGTCTGGAATGSFTVVSTSSWSSSFPVFGEAAAVAGGNNTWNGDTAPSGSVSTSVTTSGACGSAIPGWHGHRVSGTDPRTGSFVKAEGAFILMSCTPDCWCAGPGQRICLDSCGEEYCYSGTSCPSRPRSRYCN